MNMWSCDDDTYQVDCFAYSLQHEELESRLRPRKNSTHRPTCLYVLESHLRAPFVVIHTISNVKIAISVTSFIDIIYPYSKLIHIQSMCLSKNLHCSKSTKCISIMSFFSWIRSNTTFICLWSMENTFRIRQVCKVTSYLLMKSEQPFVSSGVRRLVIAATDNAQ